MARKFRWCCLNCKKFKTKLAITMEPPLIKYSRIPWRCDDLPIIGETERHCRHQRFIVFTTSLEEQVELIKGGAKNENC